MLGQLSQTELVEGKTIGIDATTLEANAAMRNIVRRDTGESYTDFLQGLAAFGRDVSAVAVGTR